MMVCDTPSNGHATTNQISLTNLERQRYMTKTTFTNYFTFVDLGVKGQGRMNVMIVHDTPSNCHAPTYQISLTYLEGQKGYLPYNFLL